jgi:tetratricopeptide (TPR) repeat protein
MKIFFAGLALLSSSLLAADVPSVSSLMAVANEAAAKGDSPSEIAAVEQAVALRRLDPGDATSIRLRIRLGSSYISGGRYFDAMAQFEQVLPVIAESPNLIKDSERFVVYTDMGRAQFVLSEYTASAENFQSAIKLHEASVPSDPETIAFVYDHLGRAQRIIGSPDADASLAKAENIYRTEKKTDNLASVQIERGRAALANGQFEPAGALFRQGKALPADFALLDKVKNPGKDMSGRFASVSADSIIPPQSASETRNLPECVANGYLLSDWVVVDFSLGEYGDVFGVSLAAASRPDLNAEPFLQSVATWIFPWRFSNFPVKMRTHQRFYLACVRPQPILIPASTTQKSFAQWAWQLVPDTLDPLSKQWIVRMKAAKSKTAETRYAALLNQRFVDKGYPEKSRSVFLFKLLAADRIIDRNYRQPYYVALSAILDAEKKQDFRLLVDATWVLTGSKRMKQYEILAPENKKAKLAEMDKLLVRARTLPVANQDLVEWMELTTALMGVEGDQATPAAEKILQDMSARNDSLDGSTVSRQAARLNLASYAYNNGRGEEADRLIDKTGLSADQCSLFGQTRRRLQLKMPAYPEIAGNRRLQGWASVDHDLSIDGRAINPRTVSAYPPFVFSSLGEATVKSTVFTPVYSKGGPIACKASDMNMLWQISN